VTCVASTTVPGATRTVGVMVGVGHPGHGVGRGVLVAAAGVPVVMAITVPDGCGTGAEGVPAGVPAHTPLFLYLQSK
jgi:hypothetical protein